VGPAVGEHDSVLGMLGILLLVGIVAYGIFGNAPIQAILIRLLSVTGIRKNVPHSIRTKNPQKRLTPRQTGNLRSYQNQRSGGEGMRSERLKTVPYQLENAIALLEIETASLENVEVSNAGG
jgi:hypothetical protein